MTFGRKFYEPLADGAPKPKSEINNDLERVIHFFPPHLKKVTDKLDEISKKFKEIKTLAIHYKNDKDHEIKKLNEDLDKFKQTIEDNNSLYETMLDKTTQSLEKIISNTSS